MIPEAQHHKTHTEYSQITVGFSYMHIKYIRFISEAV